MSTVYLDSLTIENFGPFYGEVVFKLSDLDGRCGILIGGKNGAGKTHLLRALYLAVVGESGRVDLTKLDKESDATQFNLEKSLNRRAQSEGQDTIRLSVTISQRDDEADVTRKVRLFREIRFRPNSSPIWSSFADRLDGSTNITDEKQLEKLRDAFLPRHLARFFFFDAERSQSLNLRQEDIVEGVSRILGLWAYAELEQDLRNLISQKIPNSFNSGAARDAADKLSELSGKISTAEGLLKNRIKEIRYLEVELNERVNELAKVEDELKSLGAVDPNELNQTQEKRNQISGEKTELETQLKTAWEHALPLSLLSSYKAILNDSMIKEEKRREWETSKAAVEPKIPQIKQDVLEEAPAEFALADDTYAYYSDRLDKALFKLFNPPPEGMAESTFITDRNDRSAQIRAMLMRGSSSISDLAKSTDQIDRLNADLREVDSRLKQFSQSHIAIERGQELHEKRGELIGKSDEFRRQLADLEIEINTLKQNIAELRGQETTHAAVVEKAEEGRELAAVAARYREVTSRIRESAAVQLREEISQNVGELWTEIVQRQREFTGLEFDSHWGCFLMRRDGQKVQWEDVNTSAGQRQVRMLAFYEALRRLAKLVPPLVVDTPLGRLDKEVRANVLDKLYLTGHQSLILSTNSEIDPEGSLFDSIRDRLARVYTLHSHGEPDSMDYQVSVSGDYFGRQL